MQLLIYLQNKVFTGIISMIIIKYLVRETLKSQMAILFILLLVFFCQHLVRILDDVVDGNIPMHLVLSLLLLSVPKMLQFILPLSLFLGLLLTLTRLYSESEITVMHACGLGKQTLIIVAMILSVFTSIVAMVNVFWASPLVSRYQDVVVSEAKANLEITDVVEGRFKLSRDGNNVLFVGNLNGSILNNVFMAQLRSKDIHLPSMVLVAERGNINLQQDGSQVVTLDNGTSFDGIALLSDFRIIDFSNCQVVIGRRKVAADHSKYEQMSMIALWKSESSNACAEFHWRLTLVVSVVIMALLVVPLSAVNPRYGRLLSMLPAILLYLIFCLLQATIRSNVGKGNFSYLMWLWGVDIVYFFIALVLNVWDTVPIRKLRVFLIGAV